MFNQPRENSGVPVAEMVGALALFLVREYKTGITTTFGEDKDAVSCDVHVLDGTHGGKVFTDALLFQGGLIGALKGYAGNPGPVLARIGQGTANPGKNPPYILIPFTDADAAVAGPYWARVQAAQFQAPAAPGAVPQPAAAAPAPAAPAAPSPAYAAPAPASAPALAGQLTAAGFAALPAEVQEMLRQSGQVPAGI